MAINNNPNSNPTNNTTTLESRLGSDVLFPFNSTFSTISGINLVVQDIQLLLLTAPGERVFRPTYGCDIMNSIWENYYTIQTEAPSSMQTALELYEPRINVLSVTNTSSNENTGLLVFAIQFQINYTDSVYNLVFPFRTSTQLSEA